MDLYFEQPFANENLTSESVLILSEQIAASSSRKQFENGVNTIENSIADD